MPRIRYLKNRNPNEQPSFISSNYDDDEDEKDFRLQSKGWWSNENIIQSLSEEKIRTLIEQYRKNISFLQNELVSRSLSPRNTGYKIERLDLHEERSYNGQGTKYNSDRRRILRTLAQSKMVRAVKEEVKRQWLEILENYNEGKSNY